MSPLARRAGAELVELRRRWPHLTREAAVGILDAAMLAEAGAAGTMDRVLDACLVVDEALLRRLAASYGVAVRNR